MTIHDSVLEDLSVCGRRGREQEATTQDNNSARTTLTRPDQTRAGQARLV